MFSLTERELNVSLDGSATMTRRAGGEQSEVIRHMHMLLLKCTGVCQRLKQSPEKREDRRPGWLK